MPARMNLSLRLRLLAGIGLGWLVLVVALLGYGHVSGGSLAKRENLVHLEYEAQLIADQLSREIADRKTMLARLAVDIDVEAPDLEAVLRAQQPLLALFDRLMVFDADGEPVADWPPFPEGGPSIGQRDYFRQVQHLRRPHVSEPYRGGETGIDQVMVIQPLLDEEGNFLGILGGNTSLRDGASFLNLRGRRLGEAGHVVLATADGQLISYPDPSRLMQPVPDAEMLPLLDLALFGWEGSGEGAMLDGEPGLMAFRQVWAANWVVGVFLPLAQVQAPLQDHARKLYWVGAGTVALMLPLLWWLLGLGLRPLHRLERLIDRVGQGDLARIELKTGMVELNQVADAFNALEVQRREALESFQSREAFLEAVLASSPVGMFLADTRGRASYFNPALERLSGTPNSGYRLSGWLRRVHPDDRRAFVDGWHRAIAGGEELKQRYRFRGPRGDWLWLEVHASRVALAGRTLGFVGLVQDITERHERERRQRWEAEHDPLTGCFNRRGFDRRLVAACEASRRRSDAVVALILLDLDHFKVVNDTAGHAAGDEMLRRVSDLLREAVRDEDAVARLGGDEFAILLGATRETEVREVAERLRGSLAEMRFSYAGQAFTITASLGVALHETDEDGRALMERADRASYRAKRGGRNRVEMAEPTSVMP